MLDGIDLVSQRQLSVQKEIGLDSEKKIQDRKNRKIKK